MYVMRFVQTAEYDFIVKKYCVPFHATRQKSLTHGETTTEIFHFIWIWSWKKNLVNRRIIIILCIYIYISKPNYKYNFLCEYRTRITTFNRLEPVSNTTVSPIVVWREGVAIHIWFRTRNYTRAILKVSSGMLYYF